MSNTMKNKRGAKVTTRNAKETLAWSARGFGFAPSHITDDRYTGRFGTITKMWMPVFAQAVR